MTKIVRATMPKTEFGNDANDNRNVPGYLEQIEQSIEGATADQDTPTKREYLKLPDSFNQTLIGRYAGIVSHCIEFPQVSTAVAMLTGASIPASMVYAVSMPQAHRYNWGYML